MLPILSIVNIGMVGYKLKGKYHGVFDIFC